MIEQITGPTVKTQVRRVRREGVSEHADIVTTEEPLEIRLYYYDGGRLERVSVSVTMRTPRHDYELAAGFLYTEGILDGQDSIERISHCIDEDVEQRYNIVNVYLKPGVPFDPKLLTRNFYTSSSCGVCGKASLEALELKEYPSLPHALPRLEAEFIYGLPGALRRGQKVFDKTGGPKRRRPL